MALREKGVKDFVMMVHKPQNQKRVKKYIVEGVKCDIFIQKFEAKNEKNL